MREVRTGPGLLNIEFTAKRECHVIRAQLRDAWKGKCLLGTVAPALLLRAVSRLFAASSIQPAACGASSSLAPNVRKLSSVDATADPAITSAIGSAGLSMKPRNIVAMAAIKN